MAGVGQVRHCHRHFYNSADTDAQSLEKICDASIQWGFDGSGGLGSAWIHTQAEVER